MKLRIVRVVSKETGLTQRYVLEKRVMPFWWVRIEEYTDDGSDLKSSIAQDIMFLMTLDGSLKHGVTRFV